MAVYTVLTEQEVSAFLQGFGLPRLVRLRATASGIENTNYFVDAEDSAGAPVALVLTLFERGEVQALPYFVALLSFLGEQGLPVPVPYRDQHNVALHHLKHKACVLGPRFAGQHPQQPTVAQCATIAAAMARMHLASSGFDLHRDNDRGERWRLLVADKLLPQLPADQAALLRQQVDDWQRLLPQLNQLPRGITHGDLFHDNALFDGDRLTGIIDFYNACDDVFIYDLAVLVNDWCSRADFSFDQQRLKAVLDAYRQVRPFNADEQHYWPAMLRFAALRFWLSRLEKWHFPGDGHQVQQKDPEPMRQLLLQRIGPH
ncbi:MAG: homoserine kinase [Gammaproteobacteria bacterium]